MSSTNESAYQMRATMMGQGPTVMLVHSSGNGPGMWRAYQKPLAEKHHVITPALLGYSPSDHPPRGTRDLAQLDLDALTELVSAQAAPVHLVGHSYGGFLAAQVALAVPHKVATLALLEPVMFGALGLTPEGRDSVDARHFQAAPWFLDEAEAGTERWFTFFVDYWNHPGAWAELAAPQKQAFLSAGWKVFEEVRTVITHTMPFSAYHFSMPTLLMRGEKSTQGARDMVQHLSTENPHAALHEIAGHGHVFPMTAWREVLPQLLQHWSTR
jgi:pimeloyl-ACP methyl ester carboxylesterase